jgi:hypothetical protein
MATALRLAFIFWMVCPFLYFMTAGANIFTVPKLRDNGAMLDQISFVSGMVCVLVMGLFYGLALPLALCGCIFALCSVLLYEWSRRTVVDRNFYWIGWRSPAGCVRRWSLPLCAASLSLKLYGGVSGRRGRVSVAHCRRRLRAQYWVVCAYGD